MANKPKCKSCYDKKYFTIAHEGKIISKPCTKCNAPITVDSITLGCVHGRPKGSMCPHCMGLNGRAPKINRCNDCLEVLLDNQFPVHNCKPVKLQQCLCFPQPCKKDHRKQIDDAFEKSKEEPRPLVIAGWPGINPQAPVFGGRCKHNVVIPDCFDCFKSKKSTPPAIGIESQDTGIPGMEEFERLLTLAGPIYETDALKAFVTKMFKETYDKGMQEGMRIANKPKGYHDVDEGYED